MEDQDGCPKFSHPDQFLGDVDQIRSDQIRSGPQIKMFEDLLDLKSCGSSAELHLIFQISRFPCGEAFCRVVLTQMTLQLKAF